jgi:hypothetical protein
MYPAGASSSTLALGALKMGIRRIQSKASMEKQDGYAGSFDGDAVSDRRQDMSRR